MYRYILEPSASVSTRGDRAVDREWSVTNLTTKEKVGSLRRAPGAFIAESESLRSTAEAADPMLALRMVFRNGNFFVDEGDGMRPLRLDDLS